MAQKCLIPGQFAIPWLRCGRLISGASGATIMGQVRMINEDGFCHIVMSDTRMFWHVWNYLTPASPKGVGALS